MFPAVQANITVEGDTKPRLAFTQAAVDLCKKLWDIHGPLMFHQSGGCCDGSAPMCYPDGEFKVGGADVLLGEVALTEERSVKFYMSLEQFNYWRHTYLTIDVVKGRGAGFSLEAPEGYRFLTRSTLMDDQPEPA